ncbi:putative high mobility group protein B2 [Monocercomonoides exilis]|uniref:putative high mobility group protein B2 n=1 Tax=Monocercomonoides exilis TaxID=2049356 RepID=UPI00355AC84A|nr:putative high mobility group protein B2 [Monocercomonoides exilis]|eukprot:MONOS_2703.1-p1 / transcript=MONOS_2703.1 / gene=MONOS_2703 / organism=Monocercomonoides_exilis_PA203 / gene_product=unspecified product / transcript_product=unspecified product / location=Mono_scaffold00057:30441-31031(-) / protein_length=133 / sequence_SO=supercontig / SO=protein_coding / is_pseudo=false
MPKGSSEAKGKKQTKKETKGKAQRAKKDPNAPKRPAQAYILYVSDKRAEIKEKHPDYKNTEIISEAAKLWKEASASEKKPYEDKAKKLKEKYEEELAAYNKKQGKSKKGKGKEKDKEEEGSEEEEEEEEEDEE